MSMRSAASCGHPLQEIAVPRGARMGALGRPVGRFSFKGLLRTLLVARRRHLTVPDDLAQQSEEKGPAARLAWQARTACRGAGRDYFVRISLPARVMRSRYSSLPWRITISFPPW